MPLERLHAVPHLVLPQMLVAGLTFPAYFALQRAGGPVLLSQIGYVAAAVGLAAGTVLLGEVYAPLTWAGAAVVAIGIALTIRAQLSPAPEVPGGRPPRDALDRAGAAFYGRPHDRCTHHHLLHYPLTSSGGPVFYSILEC